MKLFDDMTFDEKMAHLEKCRLEGLECIRQGYPSNLADIADWLDLWGPWLIDQCAMYQAEADRFGIRLNKWKEMCEKLIQHLDTHSSRYDCCADSIKEFAIFEKEHL